MWFPRRSVIRGVVAGVASLTGCSRNRSGPQSTTGMEPSASLTTETPSVPRTETTTGELPQSGDDALRWTYEIGHDSQFQPVATDDSIYVPSDDLYALTTDGRERWVFETEGRIIHSPVVGDAVYLTWPAVRAIEFDGTERWTFDGEAFGPPYSLDLTDDTFYVGTQGDVDNSGDFPMFAIDTTTGRQRWRAKIGAPSDAVAAEDTIFVVSPRRVRAFDIGDGTKLWERRVRSDYPKFVGLRDDVLLVRTTGLVALDRNDGSTRWEFETEDGLSTTEDGVGSGVLVDGTFYAPMTDGIAAIDVSGPERRWVSRQDYAQPDYAVEVVASDTVYALSDSQVVALDARTGANRWTWQSEKRIHSLVEWAGILYVEGETWLVALGRDGSEVWRFDFGLSTTRPVVSPAGLFVGTRKQSTAGDGPTDGIAVPGSVYAFHV